MPLTSRRGTSGRSRRPLPRSLRSRSAWPRPFATTPWRSRRIAPSGSGRSLWLGLDDGRSILRDMPDSAIGWQMLGQIELARDPSPAYPPSPRYRLPFDPVLDLSPVRATYALLQGLEQRPDDFTDAVAARRGYGRRGMHEAALPCSTGSRSIAARLPISAQGPGRDRAAARVSPARSWDDPPATTWRNLAELDRVVTGLLATGRRPAPPTSSRRPTRRSGRPGTCWTGWPPSACTSASRRERGRSGRKGLGEAPDPAVAAARIGATYLAEGDFESARRAYRRALAAKPGPLRGVLQPGRPGAGRRRCDGRLRAGDAGRRVRPERPFSRRRRDDRRRRRAVRGKTEDRGDGTPPPRRARPADRLRRPSP